MKVTILISSLLVFLGQFNIVNGGQVALRPRPKNPVLSRSIASDGSMFDPTDEESFYVVGDDPNTVIETIHQASERNFVNFEKFEDYLLPQERLCTPSLDHKTTVLTFPLNREHYLAARERWAGGMRLIFIGHHPSCYAPEEERSAFKSLSIAFNDASLTIRVTGKPLNWGDRHFPAPTELIIGRAPPDFILTRRSTNEQSLDIPGLDPALDCVEHLGDCKDEIIEHLTVDIDTADSDDKHIDFNSVNNEPHKKYWPPDGLKDRTGVPELFELYCLECRTSGGMDQEFHVLFNPVDGSDDDDKKGDKEDEDHRLNRRDDHDDDDFAKKWKNHVKRAFVRYTVTDEIKIREQLEILSPVAADIYCSIPLVSMFNTPLTMSCGPAYTGGALQWEPASAKEDKAGRAKAKGPKEVGDPKAGSGKHSDAWGYTIWPMDVGVYAWFNIGVGTQINMTLPGYEATIEVGSEFEVDLMGGADEKGPVNTIKFDPIIEILPIDLSISSSDIHFNFAVGPKAGINIGLPKGNLAVGAGIRLDLIRFDNKLSEYKNVTSACTAPKATDEAFENAFGFTMDLKTGIYAFINIAGFYIDTSWIGDKVGSGFSGLYWGIKNLVARCSDCGNKLCVSQPFNDLFDSARDALGMNGTKFRLHELGDSEHVSKDGIYSLDNQMVGEDMPTGNPNTSCVAKPAPPKYRRDIFGDEDIIYRRDVFADEDVNPCQVR